MDAKRMATDQLYSTVNRKECIDRRISGLTSVQRLSTERGGEGKFKPPFTPLENLRNRQEVSVTMAHWKTNVDPGGSESTSVGKKLHRTHAANIKEKISQWEGKEPPPPSPKGGVNKMTDSSTKSNGKPSGESQRAEDSRAAVCKDKQNSGKENIGMRGDLRPCSPAGRVMEPTGWLQNRDGRPGEGHKGLDCNKPDKEKPNINNVDQRPGSPVGAVKIQVKTLRADSGGRGLEHSTQEKKAMFTLFRKLEQAMGENVRKTPAELGNYFSPPGRDTQGVARQATQPDAATGPLDASREERQRRGNTYNVPGTPLMINPVPKPQRTFQHPITVPPGKVAGQERSQSNLYPCPPVSPPPPPSQPPLGVYRRPRGNKLCGAINRKSFEFEDLPVSHSQSASPGFPGTLSQEHHYEDIPDLSNENPYEDIEVASLCSQQSLPPSPGADTNKPSRPGFFPQSSAKSFKMLDLRRTHHRTRSSGSAGVSSPPQLSPTGSVVWLPGEPYNQTCRRIPTIVLKINSIFEARIGKKHLRRVCHYYETSSGRDENSDSESEVEERPNAHRHRPVPLQSSLSQLCQKQAQYSDAPSRPSSLREAQRQELHQRQLFEYFLVVSLQKAKAGSPYLPKVTQQFPPMLERSFKFMRETEDQLRIIPQFCFPDAEDWEPVERYPSEMFSFVLTGEDGSRRFGYCRRLLPSGKGRRLPEVYCIVSHLGCFNLFSKVLDEVERRRALSPALVQPFMRAIMEAQFPAPGRTITIKTFLPGSGTEVMELCRPPDSRLEHVDLECLFTCLSLRLLLRVLGSLLLERRVIFTARKLSTLSQCCHAAVALLYPFVWQHTYIPVLPSAMLDIVCTPTPFIVGLLSTFLPQLTQLPLEEVLVVNLENSRILRQSDDEDCTLPSKLQSALETVLEKRRELANERGAELPNDSGALSTVVSEAFVRFFVELVGHYPLFVVGEREDGYSSSSSSPVPCSFQAEAFRKSVTSKSVRRFLEVFMETQMFSWFIQEREQHNQAPRGLFEVRVQEYLDSIQENEHRRVNRFLKGLGNKMKFLSKK